MDYSSSFFFRPIFDKRHLHITCTLYAFKVHPMSSVYCIYILRWNRNQDFTSELFKLTGLEYQMVFIAESHLLFWRSLLNFWSVVYTYLNFLSLIGNKQSISLKKWSLILKCNAFSKSKIQNLTVIKQNYWRQIVTNRNNKVLKYLSIMTQ